jgi:hypothetical protein
MSVGVGEAYVRVLVYCVVLLRRSAPLDQRTTPRVHLQVKLEFNPTESQHVPRGGRLDYVHRSPASYRRRRKGNQVPGEYNWATVSHGDINTDTWSSRLGVGRRPKNLFRKNNDCCKIHRSLNHDGIDKSDGIFSKGANRQ